MPQTQAKPSLPEFTAMLAMLFALIALSIDAMLPALPQIASDLTPEAANQAQLVVSTYVFGLGAGILAAGPLTDAFGRLPVIFAGLAVFLVGTVIAHQAESLEILLFGRVIQGLGTAGPRIAGLAMIRDLFVGRDMARVTSFIMTIFMVVPALAPSLGALVLQVSDWRTIFVMLGAFAFVCFLWVFSRQAETLKKSDRRALSGHNLAGAIKELLRDRDVVICTVVMTLGYGQMFALISSIQPLFEITYGRGDTFPLWFAGIALIGGTAGLLNARLVMTLGMRKVTSSAYGLMVIASAAIGALIYFGLVEHGAEFLVFLFWATGLIFIGGVTYGNLNTIAMRRMGHIAGMAASLVSAISTMAAVAIAAPVGLAFDGTPLPAILSTLFCSTLAWLLMRATTKDEDVVSKTV
jgi:MFS transporter, DHA1 family, multidrug resistance protein